MADEKFHKLVEETFKKEHERVECEKVILKLSTYVDKEELEDMEDWSLTDLQDRLILELEEALSRTVENSRKFSERRINRYMKLLKEHGIAI